MTDYDITETFRQQPDPWAEQRKRKRMLRDMGLEQTAGSEQDVRTILQNEEPNGEEGRLKEGDKDKNKSKNKNKKRRQ